MADEAARASRWWMVWSLGGIAAWIGVTVAVTVVHGKVTLESGPEGVFVTRRGNGSGRWMLTDLFLAEAFAADAAGEQPHQTDR